MATKLSVALFISSAIILLITTVIVLVPNLISIKICLSMTELQTFMEKMRPVPGAQQPPAPTTDGPPRPSCDYGMSVSVGIWRCKVETSVPAALLGQVGLMGQTGQGAPVSPLGQASQAGQRVPVGPVGQAGNGVPAGSLDQLGQGIAQSSSAMVPYTWEGSYKTLGDNTETAFDELKLMMGSMGVGHAFFAETAAEALGDLVRTIYIRVEIEVTVALLFALIAVVITFLNMFGEKNQIKPMSIIWAALCHIIQAILLGVALGSFAQQLHQAMIYGSIYRMMTISNQGLGLLVLGFSVVFAAIAIAITHLWMLACHFRKEKEPRPEVNYSLLTQTEDA